ncbi:MAG: cupin domain-containing protein [Acidimicrobiia bacterium]|nr:cupin domain-containing protein [Acidimicrobiia bacterium]
MSPTGTSDGADAVLVRAAEAEVLTSDPAGSITLLADSDTSGGALTSNRALLREGSVGAPPHYHTRCTELFFVLGGSLQVLTGERVLTLAEGDQLLVPPRLAHAFAPAPGSDADILVVFAPGMARFDYYRLLDRLQRGEASPQDVLDSQERFDNHYIDSPVWREARATA